jgi:hypothetical protein
MLPAAASTGLLAACSTYQPDAALSPEWPGFSACMAREQAKLAPGEEFPKAVVARCNEEGRKSAAASRQPEK